MDLRILEIASNTENNKVLDNFTHKSKNKNTICGDEMEISLIVKNFGDQGIYLLKKHTFIISSLFGIVLVILYYVFI